MRKKDKKKKKNTILPLVNWKKGMVKRRLSKGILVNLPLILILFPTYTKLGKNLCSLYPILKPPSYPCNPYPSFQTPR